MESTLIAASGRLGANEMRLNSMKTGWLFSFIFGLCLFVGCAGIFAGKKPVEPSVPAWFFSIPQEKNTVFIIGGCGHFVEPGRENREAREMAAYRLACSIETEIRVGIASRDSGLYSHTVQFVRPLPDSLLIAMMETNLTVIDSFQWGNGFYILAAQGKNPRIPAKLKERKPLSTFVGEPEWLKQTPAGKKYYYGVGMSQGSGPLAWEKAEQRARAELAIQREIISKGLYKEYLAGEISIHDITLKQHITAVVKDARIIARAIDENGILYALARQKIE